MQNMDTCLNSSWLRVTDPMFASLHDREDFKKVIKKVDDYKAFMKQAYSNALNRMEASQELKNSLK